MNKKISVVLLAVIAVGFAGLADAAPKKRNRNANRVGPYGMGALGYSSWTGDQSAAEDFVVSEFEDNGIPGEDVTLKTEENDVGYNITFGYRFSRYFAAELGLAQFGSVETTGRADAETEDGTVPVGIKLGFSAGGPMLSAIGILPLNEKFELFGRLGYLFTSSERELTSRVDGQAGALFGSIKGDSQDVVLGVGASYNVNQVYSVRLEYQQIDKLGESDTAGEEDVNVISVGMLMRF
jgi:OmpA-OmpF porin, OOP family